MPLLHREDWQSTSWGATYLRFLATASQAARNASATISNQLICHNPYAPSSNLPTTYLQPAPKPPNGNIKTTKARGFNSRSAPQPSRNNATNALPTIPTSKEHVDPQFKAYPYSQGSRALEPASVEQHQKCYNDSTAWKKKLLQSTEDSSDLSGSELAKRNIRAEERPRYGLFERSVEHCDIRKPASPGVEELGRDWARICSKYGSKSTQCPLPSPEHLIPRSTDIAWNGESLPRHFSQNIVGNDMTTMATDSQDRCSNVGIGTRGPILPPYGTSNYAPPAAEATPPASSTTTLGGEFTSLGYIHPGNHQFHTPPLTQSTYAHGTPSPTSPATPTNITIRKFDHFHGLLLPTTEESPFLALYPADHRLGFDCRCSVCEQRKRKLRTDNAAPTLFERRAAAREEKKLDAYNRKFNCPTSSSNRQVSEAAIVNSDSTPTHGQYLTDDYSPYITGCNGLTRAAGDSVLDGGPHATAILPGVDNPELSFEQRLKGAKACCAGVPARRKRARDEYIDTSSTDFLKEDGMNIDGIEDFAPQLAASNKRLRRG